MSGQFNFMSNQMLALVGMMQDVSTCTKKIEQSIESLHHRMDRVEEKISLIEVALNNKIGRAHV